MSRAVELFILPVLLLVPVVIITMVLPRLAGMALGPQAAVTPSPQPVSTLGMLAPHRPSDSAVALAVATTAATAAPTPAPSQTPPIASQAPATNTPSPAATEAVSTPTPGATAASDRPVQSTPTPGSGPVYIAQIAAHATRDAAEARQHAAQAQGVQAQVLPPDSQPDLPPDLWLVYVGPFPDRAGARAQADALQAQGYGGAFVREVRR